MHVCFNYLFLFFGDTKNEVAMVGMEYVNIGIDRQC